MRQDSNRETLADLIQAGAIPPLTRTVALAAADIVLESQWLKSRDQLNQQVGITRGMARAKPRMNWNHIPGDGV